MRNRIRRRLIEHLTAAHLLHEVAKHRLRQMALHLFEREHILRKDGGQVGGFLGGGIEGELDLARYWERGPG